MSISLQVEAVPAFQAGSAALYPPLKQPQLAPLLRHHEELAAKADHRLELPLAELNFRHLRTSEEIASIVHLRKEIQLVAAGADDPGFVAREKKETRRALSPLSSAAARLSGRFASYQ